MIIDFEGHRIYIKDEIIYLTTKESEILELIYNNREKVITYQEITNKIYKINCDKSLKNLIRKYISQIRKKVNKYIKIKTIRDVGYIIEEELK